MKEEIKNTLKFLKEHFEKVSNHLKKIHFDIQGRLPKENIEEIDKYIANSIFNLQKIIDYIETTTK